MKNTWITARGSKIELITEHVTEEEVSLDGHKFITNVDYITVQDLIADGKSLGSSFTVQTQDGKHIMNLGFEVNGKHAVLVIPDNVYEIVWGDCNKRRNERENNRIEHEIQQIENEKNVINAMTLNGTTY